MKYNKRDKKGRFYKPEETSFYEPKQKTAKVEQKITLVNYILDQSGSMQVQLDSVINGFNEYVKTLDKNAKSNEVILFYLTLFNANFMGGIKIVRPYTYPVNIGRVNNLDKFVYSPSGMTPLYDAVGKTIEELDEIITEKRLKISRVLTVIHTDGEENSSSEFNVHGIKSVIRQKENTGFWTFVYIGAAASTWQDSNKIGLSHNNTIAYDPINTKGMFASAARSTLNFMCSDKSSTDAFFSGGSLYKDGKEVKALKRHKHISSDGYTRYEAVKWANGEWSCNCPGWAFNKKCKHIADSPSAIQK